MRKVILFLGFYFAWFIGYGQSNFIVQPGTELKLSNYLVLENTHLTNNGSINLTAGTFKFSGNINTNISGTIKPLFNNIELAKTGSAQLVLQTDVIAWGTINFTSGILHLNNHVLDLGKFGSLINENESSRAIGPTGGYIQWADVLNAPAAANPGNLGAIITTAQNLGTTTVRRGHVSQTNGTGSGSSILRYYDIIPTNNSSLNATLRITYLDAELNGLPEPSLTVWKSINLSAWNNLGFDSRNTTSNYVEKTGLNDFSRWTLSSPGNALPVHFSAFSTKCNGNSIIIKWATETEMQTKLFEVQRSADGRNWVTAASLPAGNSPYSFTDNSPAKFYRIAEVDLNGSSMYSAISRISCGSNIEFSLWPNPSNGQAWLSVSAANDQRSSLRIIDAGGRLVYYRQVTLFAGNNTISIDAASLTKGTYVVELVTAQEKKSAKLVRL